MDQDQDVVEEVKLPPPANRVASAGRRKDRVVHAARAELVEDSTPWGEQLVLRATWAKNDTAFRAWHAVAEAEEVLQPEVEIVDAHHHLWDMRSLKGYNLFGLFSQQYYMAKEMAEDVLASGHKVTHTVYAEAHAFGGGLGEARFAQGMAAQFAVGKYGGLKACAGVIGGVELTKLGAAAGQVLRAMQQSCPNLRGFRVNAQHDQNLEDGFRVEAPGLYATERFRRVFAALGPLGLSFDAFVYASQLQDVRALALAFPGTTIILNHMGAPACALGPFGRHAPGYVGQQAGIIQRWQADMKAIAHDCPNVAVKLGGLLGCLGHGWAERPRPVGSAEVAGVIGPLVKFVIATFGAQRCMFQSNFPVDKAICGYRTLWNAYKRVVRDAGIGHDERALLFSGTAMRVYRLAQGQGQGQGSAGTGTGEIGSNPISKWF